MNKHELDVIIQEGENQRTEFKRNVNSDISRELAAFANSSGGKIFIGIEDNGTVYGIKTTNELRSRIESMARDCDPPIPVGLEALDNVLIVHVQEGKDKPYRCANGFYIRSGASSVKLSTQEIIEFIKSEGKVMFEQLHTPSVKYPDSLDASAINRYVRLSGISEVIGTNELLANLGVLYEDGATPILNNAGILFFAKHPARVMPHGAVTCLLFKGNTKLHIIDRKSYEFDLITNINESVAFLERHLNLAYEIKGIRRKEILEIPELVLREAVINSIAHRNYFEKGANVMVEIFDNRIEISNPGGLPKGLKPENFGKYSVARNPLIAGLLHRCHYIEKVGTGIQRMRDGMKEADLPEPTFEFSNFFTVILQRSRITDTKVVHELQVTPDRMERILIIIRKLQESISLNLGSLAKQLDTSDRTIRRDLDLLERHGWVKSIGATRNRQYMLTQDGAKKIAELL